MFWSWIGCKLCKISRNNTVLLYLICLDLLISHISSLLWWSCTHLYFLKLLWYLFLWSYVWGPKKKICIFIVFFFVLLRLFRNMLSRGVSLKIEMLMIQLILRLWGRWKKYCVFHFIALTQSQSIWPFEVTFLRAEQNLLKTKNLWLSLYYMIVVLIFLIFMLKWFTSLMYLALSLYS